MLAGASRRVRPLTSHSLFALELVVTIWQSEKITSDPVSTFRTTVGLRSQAIVSHTASCATVLPDHTSRAVIKLPFCFAPLSI